ncbi:hypothetical protein HK096_011264, partial [Nowakowskiella sp. JEL0078]
LIASILEEHTFIPGDLILREGQMINNMFIIKEGYVEFVHNQEIIGNASETDFFGESGLLRESAMRSEVSVVAREYSILLSLHKNDFLAILELYPNLILD